MSSKVQFLKLLTSGKGITGNLLGDVNSSGFIMNAVELQFFIPAEITTLYKNITPVQFAGSSAYWLKRGTVLNGTWSLRTTSKDLIDGKDNPEPEFIKTLGKTIAYYDSPGPNTFALDDFEKASQKRKKVPPLVRAYIVQNFTGWISGINKKTGKDENLCGVAAWNSIINITKNDPGKALSMWTRTYGSGASLGWKSTTTPPVL